MEERRLSAITMQALFIVSVCAVRTLSPATADDTTTQSSTAPQQYHSRVVKVPNTSKYAPYHGPTDAAAGSSLTGVAGTSSGAATSSTAANSAFSPDGSPALVGIVDDLDEADDTTYHGVGPLSDGLLASAPPMTRPLGGAASSTTFRSWLRAHHDRDFSGDRVLVLKGKWDHAEHVLDLCNIGYTTTDERGLEKKLVNASVLVIDCPGTISSGMIPVVRDWLQAGGYLLTTDWALDGCLQQLCPGYVYFDGAYTEPSTIDAVEVEPENDLLKGGVKVAPWKLDDKCEIVKLGYKKSVDVLLRSRKLMKQDPNGLGVLALSFPFGSGRVLHLVGHFDFDSAFSGQLPDPAPGIKISLRQVVALNFIAQGLEQRPQPNQ